MSSKRAREGYLVIDHRDTPGIPDAEAAIDGTLGYNRALFESATHICNHCQAIIVLNPKRDRPREHCRKCDSYICDGCGYILAQTLECVPFEKLVEQTLKAAMQQAPEAPTILLP